MHHFSPDFVTNSKQCSLSGNAIHGPTEVMSLRTIDLRGFGACKYKDMEGVQQT